MLELSIYTLFSLRGSDPYGQTLVAMVAVIALGLMFWRWRA